MNTKTNFPSALRLTSLGAVLALGSLGLTACNSGGGGATSSGGGGGVLATVGTDSVTRDEFNSALEASHGPEVLAQLIDYHLLLQKADADGIQVTDADVDAALAAKPQLAAALAAGGPQADSIKRSTRLELVAQKVIAADVKPTEADLAKFFAKYAPQWYDEGAAVLVGTLVSTTKTRADVMAEQLKSKTKTFAQLVDEQKKANDPVASMSEVSNPQPQILSRFREPIRSQLTSLPENGNTSPFPINLGGGMRGFAIMRVIKHIPAKKADLAKLHSTVELDYKLAQVAMKIVGENKANPPFDQTIERTARALAAQNGSSEPGFRDVLMYIDQVAINRLVSNLHGAGEVKIEDMNYAMMSNMYASGGGAPAGAAPAGAPPAGAPK